MPPSRQIWVDNARVLAAVAVIAIHVASPAVLGPTSSPVWWVGHALDSASRWSVPVFFLLSGALLLEPRPDESWRDFYAKRLGRVGLPVISWTLAYAALFVVRRQLVGRPVAASEVLDRVLSGEAHFHLWYLYALLPLYLLTPMIRQAVERVSTSAGALLCGLGLGLAAVETHVRGDGAITVGPVWLWWLPYLPWFAAGVFAARLDAASHRPLAAGVGILGVLGTFVGVAAQATEVGLGPGAPLYGYLSVPVIAAGLAAFHLLRGSSRPVLPAPWLRRVADASLAVYLLHPALIEGLRFAGLHAEDHPLVLVGLLIALPVLSFALVDPLRRIPGLSRLIG